jgi:hypothetical protein
MKTLDTALAFDRSEIAKFRLHCVELFISQGWSAFYQAFPQVGRRSVYRWKRSCLNSGQKLSSLFPHSTRPHWVRQMQIPATILGFLRTMRTKYLLDGVELVFSGIHCYFLTAVELITRQDWVKRVPCFSGPQAKLFLADLLQYSKTPPGFGLSNTTAKKEVLVPKVRDQDRRLVFLSLFAIIGLLWRRLWSHQQERICVVLMPIETFLISR